MKHLHKNIIPHGLIQTKGSFWKDAIDWSKYARLTPDQEKELQITWFGSDGIFTSLSYGENAKKDFLLLVNYSSTDNRFGVTFL
jgi:hypothetical protein